MWGKELEAVVMTECILSLYVHLLLYTSVYSCTVYLFIYCVDYTQNMSGHKTVTILFSEVIYWVSILGYYVLYILKGFEVYSENMY